MVIQRIIVVKNCGRVIKFTQLFSPTPTIKCIMTLMTIHSDWMCIASSGLYFSFIFLVLYTATCMRCNHGKGM